MPFYEYACSHCGATTEKLQKISDPPATECPVCHQQTLSKLVSAAGFRLKGGGWYETDFKSANKKNLAGGEAANPTGDLAAKPKENAGGDAPKSASATEKAAPAKPAKSSSEP